MFLVLLGERHMNEISSKEVLSLTTTKDKASYSLGFEMGKGLRSQFSDLDISIFAHALRDAFNNYSPRIKAEEMKEILTAIQNQVMQQQKQLLGKMAEENKKASEEFLAKNKTEQGIVVLPSGLQYKVISSGREGASPTSFDSVLIHYRASFVNGTVFESTYEGGEPKKIPINQMIPGWAEALKMMKAGDKWQIFVPPYLAYGEAGYPPIIGPNTLLIFDIELLSIA